MNKPQRILIVDDNPSLREGLSSILSHFPAFDTVGEAADGVEALKSVEKFASRPRSDGYIHAPDGRYSRYQGNQEKMAGD